MQSGNVWKNTFIGPHDTSHHSCALHAPNAAENIQPFTFHQTPPSQLAWFQGMSSYSKRAEHSQSCTGEHRWFGNLLRGRKVRTTMFPVMTWRSHSAEKLVQVEVVGRDILEDLSLVCLVEELLDVSLDVAGEEPPAVTLEGHAIWPYEELLEVPGHVIPADRAPDD